MEVGLRALAFIPDLRSVVRFRVLDVFGRTVVLVRVEIHGSLGRRIRSHFRHKLRLFFFDKMVEVLLLTPCVFELLWQFPLDVFMEFPRVVCRLGTRKGP